MEALAAPASTPNVGIPKHAGRRMTKQEFLKWESDDAFVYEFNDGILEPTPSMKPEEKLLVKRLTRRFLSTNAFQNGGELMPEMDCWVTEKQMRRPDLSCYTESQIVQDALGNQPSSIPAFVIELISETDEHYKTTTKLREYFEAGVQVVWWIFPPFKTVEVYTSPKTVVIATDDDLISAAPALPDYELKVSDLFADVTAA